MKTPTITACGLLVVWCCHSQGLQEPSANHSTNNITLAEALPLAKAHLEELDHVGGFAGFAITPTPFLKLSIVFIETGDRKLFDSFLASTNPTIQAMGLTCLSQTDTDAFQAAWSKMKDDAHELTVWTGLCIPSRVTLGRLSTKLKENHNYLGHADDYWDFQKFRETV